MCLGFFKLTEVFVNGSESEMGVGIIWSNLQGSLKLRDGVVPVFFISALGSSTRIFTPLVVLLL